MKSSVRLAALGGFAAAAAAFVPALPWPPASHRRERCSSRPTPSAGTRSRFYDAAVGTLRPAGTYPTGGLGGVLGGSVVDHLASQGSLAYDRTHGLLYAVNAGSNTVTVFSVAGDRLIRHQILSSGGTFPVSVTTHGNLVYVLNARDGGSVQGFLRVGTTLVKIPAWHRDLGLNPAQTPEFTHPRPDRVHPGRVEAGRHDQRQRQRHRRVRRRPVRRPVGEARRQRGPR